MSLIFISHSSRDRAAAEEMRARLLEQEHTSVFLSFDPESGIPAGRDWEKELYRSIRGCRAVIVLCSEHSMSSKWCFMEITYARALGKHLFPVKIDDCQLDGVLTDRQAIDLTRNPEEDYKRLWHGILAAGLNPADAFDWDGSRPPYPGLLAFQEEDAAIFFGRDDEIGEGLDLLNKVRRRGSTGLVMVLGASGSGKSSLVRAGLLPRLRRDVERWLVVEPFRPREDPNLELAASLSRTFARKAVATSQKRILERLRKAPGGPPPTGAAPEIARHLRAPRSAAERVVPGSGEGAPTTETNAISPNPFLELATELRLANGRSEAAVLLVIDQFEELLGHPGDHPSSRFLALLREALEQPGRPLLVLGTMRSDFLSALQKSTQLTDLRYESLSIGPMSAEDIAQIIEKPAEVAGLELESGLVQALVDDAQTEDALPLLAFALYELSERYGEDKFLAVGDYRKKLGGLQGALARSAEELHEAEQLSPELEGLLRRSLLSMVRMTEDGSYARRPTRWDDLPAEAHPLLERFVQARLLVSGGDDETRTLEVAHEALFRSWGRLVAWLDQGAEALRLGRELRSASRSWDKAGRRDGDLWRGARLARARELIAGEDLALDELGAGFVDSSHRFERAGIEAELRRQRRELQRTRIFAAVVAVAFLIAAGLAWVALRAKSAAVESAVEANSLRIVAKFDTDQALAPEERTALWELALADEALREATLGRFLSSEPTVRSFNAHNPYLVHALLGIDPERRIEPVARVVQDACTADTLSNRFWRRPCFALAAELLVVPGEFEAGIGRVRGGLGDSLYSGLERARDLDVLRGRLSEAGAEKIRELYMPLAEETAGELKKKGTEWREDRRRAATLSLLAKGLAAGEAGAIIGVLAMADPQQDPFLAERIRPLADLGARLPPDVARLVVADSRPWDGTEGDSLPLLEVATSVLATQGLEQKMVWRLRALLEEGLPVLVSRLAPDTAAEVETAIVNRIVAPISEWSELVRLLRLEVSSQPSNERFSEPRLLSTLVRSLAALPLPETRPLPPRFHERMVGALGAVGERLSPFLGTAATTPLVLTREPDEVADLVALTEALATLGPRLDTGLAESAARELEALIFELMRRSETEEIERALPAPAQALAAVFPLLGESAQGELGAKVVQACESSIEAFRREGSSAGPVAGRPVSQRESLHLKPVEILVPLLKLIPAGKQDLQDTVAEIVLTADQPEMVPPLVGLLSWLGPPVDGQGNRALGARLVESMLELGSVSIAGALVPHLDSGLARTVAERFLEGYVVGHRQPEPFDHLVRRLQAADARAVALRLAAAMVDPRNSSLAPSLALLAEQMGDPRGKEELLAVLLSVIDEEEDPHRRVELWSAVAVLKGVDLDPDRLAVASKELGDAISAALVGPHRGRDLALGSAHAGTLAALAGPEAAVVVDSVRRSFETLRQSSESSACDAASHFVSIESAALRRYVVEEVLKWPTCRPEDRQAIVRSLARAGSVEALGTLGLPEEEGDDLHLDRWVFAAWASKQGYDVTRDPMAVETVVTPSDSEGL